MPDTATRDASLTQQADTAQADPAAATATSVESDKRTANANTSAGDAAVSRIARGGHKPAPAPTGGEVGTGKDNGTTPAAGNDALAQVKQLLAGPVSMGVAQQVLGIISKSSDANAIIDGMGPNARLALATTLEQTSKSLGAGERASIKPIFDRTPDGEVATLEALLGARFAISKVGADAGKKGVAWDPAGLRQAWGVLEALPPAHVEGNNSLVALVRYKVKKGSQGEGYYADAPDFTAAIGYDPTTLAQGDKDYSEEKDPMYGVNAFNETVRHEIGHSVDAMLNGSNRYCIGNAAGGNWKDHGAPTADLVNAVIADAAGPLSTWDNAKQKQEIVDGLAKAIKGKGFDPNTFLSSLPFWKDLDQAKQKSLSSDLTFSVLSKNTTAEQPWMNGGEPGVAVNGRIYQESYDKQWTSYAVEARARKVSLYQFRAPGEWFAESYAAYYEPTTGNQQKGYKLNAVDPNTKAWFDKNIDTIPTALNRASGGGPAARGGGPRKAS